VTNTITFTTDQSRAIAAHRNALARGESWFLLHDPAGTGKITLVSYDDLRNREPVIAHTAELDRTTDDLPCNPRASSRTCSCSDSCQIPSFRFR
jgi:hypothetical protein